MTEVFSKKNVCLQGAACMVAVSQQELKALYKKISNYEKQLLESQKLNQQLLKKITELTNQGAHPLSSQ